MSESLTLADAIRLGGTFRAQSFAGWFTETDGSFTSCALGGALEAIDIRVEEWSGKLVTRFWPEIDHAKLRPCPCSGHDCLALMANVVNMAGHLNDDHEWSRSRIADWVESVTALSRTAVTEAVEAFV